MAINAFRVIARHNAPKSPAERKGFKEFTRNFAANRSNQASDLNFAAPHGDRAAADPHPRQTTWINGRIVELYNDLFDMGYAHSVECWRDGRLVGGLYGVAIGGAFFGESMFSRASDASKAALVHLVARLRHGGYALLDTQFVTDHLSQFGTVEVVRGEYLQLLARALRRKGDFYSLDGASGCDSGGASAGIGSTK